MATSKTGKPSKSAKPKRDRSGALYVLLEREQLEALDAWADTLNAGRLVPLWNRSDIVRAVLARALTERGAKGEEP
ncbi:MAG: hypothetical protein JNK05_17815 [Myxococcales bacterium]|nr:hypothetical protein [Myxococcales bacterium]